VSFIIIAAESCVCVFSKSSGDVMYSGVVGNIIG